MLHQFLTEHRDELIKRTREKMAERPAPRASENELKNGVPLFLEQLVQTLRLEEEHSSAPRPDIGEVAARHGAELLRMGFMVAQVVHGYGDVCQSVTELAVELEAAISAEEFRTLNRCLDDAIAGAVTEYARQREQSTSDRELQHLGFLAHELRNMVSTSLLSYEILAKGNVEIAGRTGQVLGRSLLSIQSLIDRTLAQIRLEAGIDKRAKVRVIDFMEDIEVSASMEAKVRGVSLTVEPVDPTILIDVDQQILASATSNLLQNAFKFTPQQGHVWLRTRRTDGRVLIEIEDQCGGLPPAIQQQLFKPFGGRGTDKSGLGLGLAISLQGVKANGGDITVRNKPGTGCVFVIDLPIATAGKAPART